MKIKSIEIYGLWDSVDIKWDLNVDVNILTGNNGSGKSTILRIVDLLMGIVMNKQLVTNIDLPSCFYKFNAAKLVFEGNYVSKFWRYKGNFQDLEVLSQQNSFYEDFYQSYKNNIDQIDFSKHANHNGLWYVALQNGVEVSSKLLCDKIQYAFVNTFDFALTDKFFEKYSLLKRASNGDNSTLDVKVKAIQERYAYYVGDLGNRVEQYALNNSGDMQLVAQMYQQKNLFLDIVDRFFRDTHKKIDRSKTELQFVLDGSDRRLSVYELSSGEKQLLYILITALIQDGRDSVVLMDEPELSLHVDWQENLIDSVRELNGNCQLIISTHAPSLLLSGWDSAVQYVEDLKTEHHE